MRYIVGLYGLLMLVGGLIGHAQGSTASLISGGIFGILLLIAAGCMFKKSLYVKGTYFALILTLLLDAFFTYRFLTTMKFMPPGLLSLISLGVLLLLVLHIRQKFPAK
ncbi:MAG: TMEM14 family protein [Verrucomicrobia bacterium]|nr:TMEM14 family protein [Verrucomicrobiota bacterium]